MTDSISAPDTPPERPKGRAAGGIARAQAMPPEQRSEQAARAAAARWSRPVLRATHGSSDHPLRIGEIEIPCYVLEDGTRVLSQSGLQTGIGMSTGGGKAGTRKIPGFLKTLAGKGIDIKDLAARAANPIQFFPTGGGRSANGYEATILADLCEVVLAARAAGVLVNDHQAAVAHRCEMLVRGFARVGIIALVDEATGFQFARTKDALARILEEFIAKELQPWVRTFPDDFYKEMFRLRGMQYPTSTVQRPRYFGVLTNDIVYDRLAPGIRDELKRVVPRGASGRHKQQLHRHLTQDTGHPKLREHLASVVTIMKLSDSYNDFKHKLDRLHPRFGDTRPLELAIDEEDSGQGL